jgi:hypothetical protein
LLNPRLGRFLDGLHPHPMVRDLTLEDAGDVFGDGPVSTMSLD